MLPSMAALTSGETPPAASTCLGGDISFRSVGADIEPEFARRGHRNDEFADFDQGDGVRHVGGAGQHIGGGALRDSQRFNRKVGIELFAVAQEKRDRAHDRRRVAGVEADMSDAGGIGLKLRPQWCRGLDVGRRAGRVFARKGKAGLHLRADNSLRWTGQSPERQACSAIACAKISSLSGSCSKQRRVDSGDVANNMCEVTGDRARQIECRTRWPTLPCRRACRPGQQSGLSAMATGRTPAARLHRCRRPGRAGSRTCAAPSADIGQTSLRGRPSAAAGRLPAGS